MNNRRVFLKQMGLATGGLLLPSFVQKVYAKENETEHLVILHNNDWHSRIDPFPLDGGRNAGMGGAAKRASLIKQIRKENPNVILLDSGDVFQGTPYFNFFGGEIEYKLMTEMGYDASTLGNHDFDNGLEGLEKALPHAGFDIICSNYDFSETALKHAYKPFKIIKKGEIRIGIFGLGIEPEGLIPPKLFGNTIYQNPIEAANKWASFLRNEKRCDLVVCLSHLGHDYKNNKISDMILATETNNINLILGGHTHTFLNEPVEKKNKQGLPVLINQVGWGGILLGRLDCYFDKTSGLKGLKTSIVKVS